MNTKRLFFWISFVVILALIVWGLIAAMNKSAGSGAGNYKPAPAVTADDHVRGPVNAPVTLVEYADFQCPACEAYEPLLEQLETTDASTTLKVVYRHYPLPQHPNALPAAYAAEAANLQGKFWEMHDLLFAHHSDWTELADPTSVFLGYATQLGLDLTKFKTDMASDVVKNRVAGNLADAQNQGLDYTPTFYLNGTVITNPQGYDQFLAIIKSAATSTAQ